METLENVMMVLFALLLGIVIVFGLFLIVVNIIELVKIVMEDFKGNEKEKQKHGADKIKRRTQLSGSNEKH